MWIKPGENIIYREFVLTLSPGHLLDFRTKDGKCILTIYFEHLPDDEESREIIVQLLKELLFQLYSQLKK
jgi:hypothetical protein